MKKPIIRAWNRLAPKVVAFLATGLSATVLIGVADTYFDVTLDPVWAGVVVTAVSTLAGYIKKDAIVLEEYEPKHSTEV